MKKVFNFVLSIITLALLILITFNKINSIAHFVDLSKYETAIFYITTYGPIVVMCLFAFGSLLGKVVSKILFVIIVLILIILTISIFAPGVIESIFGKHEAAEAFSALLSHI